MSYPAEHSKRWKDTRVSNERSPNYFKESIAEALGAPDVKNSRAGYEREELVKSRGKSFNDASSSNGESNSESDSSSNAGTSQGSQDEEGGDSDSEDGPRGESQYKLHDDSEGKSSCLD